MNATIRLFTEPEKQRARYLVSHPKSRIEELMPWHFDQSSSLAA